MTEQQIAKWIDYLQGELDVLKRTAGGSGGSTVTITPTLQSGEKLADFSINGTEGAIYAPQNNFSTTPEVVGKWIDGRNVKRVVITHEQTTATTGVDIILPTDVDIVIGILAKATNDINELFAPYTVSPDTFYAYHKRTANAITLAASAGIVYEYQNYTFIVVYVEAAQTSQKTGGKNNGRHKTDL